MSHSPPRPARGASSGAACSRFSSGHTLRSPGLAWLCAGAGPHLALTLVGSRSTSASTLNLAAWAGIPYAVRSLVRAAFVYLAHRLIASPGLGGFAPVSGEGLAVVAAVLLGLVDVYLIWHVLLLVTGVHRLPGGTALKDSQR